jgi:hypothetical protein
MNYWNAHIFFSHGTVNLCGTVTIITKHIQFELLEENIDPHRRFIIIHGHFNDMELTLVNTYLPTQDREELQVIDVILPFIEDSIHNIIWGADLNVHMNLLKNHYKAKVSDKSDTVNNLDAILNEWNICDIWRILNQL